MVQEQPVSDISSYHAHIYYDAETKNVAETMRGRLEEIFPDLTYGRWHDRPVGPHPSWSTQVAFPASVFPEIVPWLTLNRDGLVIFVHTNTGDDLVDHRDHAIWLGDSQVLDLSIF
ncbi:MAG: DOPA 4,5-dioxygenase family protein [Rhizobiales bacterium]|nr:DOPA 4,5-dioxygenase family protein [Hyphomicrobiales bacterium]